MPLLELQGIADGQIRRGLDTLNGFAEGGFYHPAYPVQMVPSGSAAWVRPVFGPARDIAAIQMPDTAARLTGSFPLPPDWVAGSVGLEILYTGDTSSTANIVEGIAITPVAIGAALPSAANTNLTIPGPATAGLLLSATSHLVAVTAASRIVCFKISQQANVYAGDPYILGVDPIWYPRRG